MGGQRQMGLHSGAEESGEPETPSLRPARCRKGPGRGLHALQGGDTPLSNSHYISAQRSRPLSVSMGIPLK